MWACVGEYTHFIELGESLPGHDHYAAHAMKHQLLFLLTLTVLATTIDAPATL